MGILGRLSTLVKSNVNDLIDSMQDPAKQIDQLIRDMEDSVREARGEVVQCLADEKRMGKRVEDLADEVKSWEEHATQAVQAGDDALAKEALRRKAEKQADRIEAEKALSDQRAYSVQLGAGLKALEARVQDVKLRRGTLREKARAAKRGESPVSGQTAAFEDFDRMSGKIDALEAEVGLGDELQGQTAASVEAERKLREMSEQKSVDDALADLKKKLRG
ncbi:MAG: PspA/IM30 family protein [Polyangia bacterium]|jgi:phage shock protein A